MSKKQNNSKENIPALQKTQETPITGGKEETMAVPNALGAEKSVLSLMLKDPETYVGKALESGVKEGYFYFSGHKVMWTLLISRFEKNLPTDITSINQALTDSGDLDSLGGTGGLAELYSYDSLGAYFDHHLELLKEKHVLRSIINTCNESVQRAYKGDEEVPHLLDSVEQSIMAIRESNEKSEAISFKSILMSASNNIEQYLATGGEIRGLSTGYSALDKKTGGLKAGDMFVVAARPAMGKTSFLLNILEHVIVEQNAPAMMFSCEMPSIQLAERMLYSRSKISKAGMVKNKDKKSFLTGEMQRFHQAILELKDAPFILDDTPSISITELRAKARRAKREKGLSIIGIDYLQLMRSYSKQAQNSREREIAEISSGLKALAKELEVPVLVLAQLNRGPDTRTGNSFGVPRMSDLRESGAIEQDADMIGLLYRTDYYSKDDNNKESPEQHKENQENDQKDRILKGGEATLELAKNRNGPTGKVPLTFYPELMRFNQDDYRIEPD